MASPPTHPAQCAQCARCWPDLEPIKDYDLSPRFTPGAQVAAQDKGGWRLQIPAGPRGRYRLAQLDDYSRLQRRDYIWRPPVHLELKARASAESLPGTWGFGFWNDPFGMALFSGAEPTHLPTLPNTAWFFIASQPNYLSLRDDLSAVGPLAATFRSSIHSAIVLAPAALALPLLVLSPTARLVRKAARRLVQQDSTGLTLKVAEWHAYSIEITPKRVVFMVDGEKVLETAVVPLGPLGLVLWIDNQYAAFRPDGKVSLGTLENPLPAWIEIRDIFLDNPTRAD